MPDTSGYEGWLFHSAGGDNCCHGGTDAYQFLNLRKARHPLGLPLHLESGFVYVITLM